MPSYTTGDVPIHVGRISLRVEPAALRSLISTLERAAAVLEDEAVFASREAYESQH